MGRGGYGDGGSLARRGLPCSLGHAGAGVTWVGDDSLVMVWVQCRQAQERADACKQERRAETPMPNGRERGTAAGRAGDGDGLQSGREALRSTATGAGSSLYPGGVSVAAVHATLLLLPARPRWSQYCPLNGSSVRRPGLRNFTKRPLADGTGSTANCKSKTS